MKKLLLPLLLVLLALPVFAQHAVLTFSAERGEVFYIKINNRVVNHTATNYVRVAPIKPGKHYVELKVRTRYGVFHMGQRIYVPEGVEANYLVRTSGRSGKAYLRMLSEEPLRHPRPFPDYHDDHCSDRNHDHYREEPPRYRDRDRYDSDCRNLMTSHKVDRLLQIMRNRGTESAKQSIARDALRNSSIMADDLKRVLQQFDFENTRVEFAKFAYDYLCDKDHLYYIYDVFKFDSSIREIERYTDRR